MKYVSFGNNSVQVANLSCQTIDTLQKGASHLYGNRTNSALLIEWKKTLYNVSWVVTISFVVWPELNL